MKENMKELEEEYRKKYRQGYNQAIEDIQFIVHNEEINKKLELLKKL